MFQDSAWEQWLKDLMADPIWGYYRGINLMLWLLAIGLMYGIGIVFWIRSKRSGVIPSQSWMLKSFALFFFLQGATRIVFTISYFIEPYYNLLLALGYAFGAVALLPLVFTIEKWSVPQTRRFFTILGIVIGLISFYFVIENSQSELSRMIQNFAMPVMMVLFLILYLWMIKNSTGVVRKKAILALVGALIFVIGILLDSETFIESMPIIFHFAPIMFMVGEIIIGISQKVD